MTPYIASIPVSNSVPRNYMGEPILSWDRLCRNSRWMNRPGTRDRVIRLQAREYLRVINLAETQRKSIQAYYGRQY